MRKIKVGLHSLDVRGLVCPFPQLLVLKGLDKLSSSDILEVILDNPPSVKDIPLALEKKGYKVEKLRVDSLTWKLKVQILKRKVEK
jgi:TusA-related sulfurtransferase